MNVLGWLLLGSIVGIFFSKGRPKADSFDMAWAFGGAVIGGIIATLLNGTALHELNIHTLLVAFFGSVILSFMGKSVL